MRTSAPPLFPVFRSQLQGELLARVTFRGQPGTLTDLARELDAPVPTVQREVSRLEEGGILRTERLGRGRIVMLNHDNPAVPPLVELVTITFGPQHVIAAEFRDVPGVDELYLFGSWAARHEGRDGAPPGDVDVLVIGQPDRDKLYDAADRAQRRLKREVNTTIISPQRWSNSDEPFLRQVRKQPLIAVHVRAAAP